LSHPSFHGFGSDDIARLLQWIFCRSVVSLWNVQKRTITKICGNVKWKVCAMDKKRMPKEKNAQNFPYFRSRIRRRHQQAAPRRIKKTLSS